MKTETIRIASKEAAVAYCYATEIAYKELSGQDIADFMAEVSDALYASRMPDVKKTILLLLAAMLAASQQSGEETPITDKDIMTAATPQELGEALGTVLNLRGAFYMLPAGESEPKKESDEKNA
jgi:hypothetical protein